MSVRQLFRRILLGCDLVGTPERCSKFNVRVKCRRSVSLVVACLAACLSAFFQPVTYAQTVETLVSNTGQSTTGASAEIVAQRFTTGANPTGYTISSVSIQPAQNIYNRSGTYVSIKTDNNNRPGTLVANLIDPGTVFPGTSPVAFAAPSNTSLDPGARYWVVINEDQSSNKLAPTRTGSGNEDSDSQDGWSIANKYRKYDSGTWIDVSDSLLIDVQGYANSNIPPVSISGGSSVREGGTVTFTVSLLFAATTDVTVQYTTSSGTAMDGTDYEAASAQTLTIPANDTSATISIVTIQDSDAEDDETFTVTLSDPSSNASIGTPSSATGTILDNDSGALVNLSGDSSAAEGSSVDFNVTLEYVVDDDVTVHYSTSIGSVSNAAAATDFTVASGATFTITAGDTSGTISIPTTDDSIDEEDETFTLTISNPSSNAILGSAVSATGTIEDDDTKGIVVAAATPLPVTEGDSADYTVRLMSEPDNNKTVKVALTVSPTGTLTFSQTELEFTPSNWNQPQTVTVTASQDDDATDNDVTITHKGSDSGYGQESEDLAVRVIDDDVPEILINAPSDPLILDAGDTGSFSVKLRTKPSAAVTLDLSSSNDDVTLMPDTETIAPGDWDTSVPIMVKAHTDPDGDDDEATLTVTASGGDYEGEGKTLNVTVEDTVTAGVILSTEQLNYVEQAPAVSYTVVLRARPTRQVEVRVTPFESPGLEVGIAAHALGSNLPLAFTRNNWDKPQNVWVGTEELDESGTQNYTLRHTSTGGGYFRADDVDLPVIVQDKDAQSGYVFDPESLSLSESESGTYKVKLRTQPSTNVNVTIADAGNILSVNPTSLPFTTTDWNDWQTVTVTAPAQVSVDDVERTLTHTGEGGGYDATSTPPGTLPVTIVRNIPSILSSGGVSVASTTLHTTNTYARDEVIVIAVVFDADVTLSTTGGTPHLEVDVGGTTKNFGYVSMADNRTLNFEYTVQAGDQDSDGISVANDALELNGGTIKSTSDQRDADVSGTLLQTQSSHRVDGSQTLAAASLGSLQLEADGTQISLMPAFSASQTSYTAALASNVSEVTLTANAAEGGTVTIVPTDASSTELGHQIEISNAETEVTVTVSRSPRPAGTYTLTLNRAALTAVSIAASVTSLATNLAGQSVTYTVARDSSESAALDVGLTFTQTQSFLPSSQLSQTVTIPANETSGTLTLTKSAFSGGATTDGDLTATIASNATYTIGSPAAATIDVITADPAVVVRPKNATNAFAEDVGVASFVFVAEALQGVTVTGLPVISFTVTPYNNTAVQLFDFSTPPSSSVVFQASRLCAARWSVCRYQVL